MGLFLDAVYFIRGRLVRSPEAILNAGTFSFVKRSTASKLNGVERKIISLLFA